MYWDTAEGLPSLAAAPSEVSCGLVALIGDAPHAWTMVNTLRRKFGDFPVIVERGEPSSKFWARRRKMLGHSAVLSQKAAMLAAKLTKPLSRARLAELRVECDARPIDGSSRRDVASANDPDAIRMLRAMKPKAVFVASTGLLRKPLLEALDCPVVNYHSGVNPTYRGINGGYYALANGEPERFGVTLHLVDRGVDTGAILATNTIKTGQRDNMQTYITLMAARSQDLVVETMTRVLEGDCSTLQPSDAPSKQYFAPTLGEYLKNGFARGVW